MKTIYHMVLHKPKTSKTWTPLYADGLVILAVNPDTARTKGLAELETMAAESSNRAAPKLHHWEIAVASVCLPDQPNIVYPDNPAPLPAK